MEIWLSLDDDRFRLPVLPPTVGVSKENLNTVINISEIGEVNLLGKPGLKTLDINSFMPNQKYSFVEHGDLMDPHKAKDKLDYWAESEKAIRLIITTTGINMLVSIEKFDWSEKDGTGDVYYSLNLKEYKDPKTRTKASQQVTETKRPVPAKKKSSSSYVVKSGDTLWAIAKKFYGNGSQYTKIYNANKKTIGANPNLIRPGQQFEIP